MSNISNNPQDENVPEGVDFLHGVIRFCSECERLTDKYLFTAKEQGSIQTHHYLGTVISLLDRASSCFWGCKGGDHKIEYIIGRCCNYGIGAFKLARAGFYDESVALARTIGETANLALLFVNDNLALQEWKIADEKTRKDKYSPFKVRLSLESKNIKVPVDKQRYKHLSEKAVHLVPTIPPQIYNSNQHPKASGYFQEVGLLFCLAEVAFPLSILGLCSTDLCDLQDVHREKIINASQALSQSLKSPRGLVNMAFPGTYS